MALPVKYYDTDSETSTRGTVSIAAVPPPPPPPPPPSEPLQPILGDVFKPLLDPLVQSAVDNPKPLRSFASTLLYLEGSTLRNLSLPEWNKLFASGQISLRPDGLYWAQNPRLKPGTPGGYEGATRDMAAPGSAESNADNSTPASIVRANGAADYFMADVAPAVPVAAKDDTGIAILLAAGLGLLMKAF